MRPRRMPDYDVKEFLRFKASMEGRLSSGSDEFKGRTLRFAPSEIVGEMQEEAIDIANYAYMLYSRLERLRAQTEDMGARLKSTSAEIRERVFRRNQLQREVWEMEDRLERLRRAVEEVESAEGA